MRWTAHWITNLHFLWWRTVGRSQRPSHTCGTIIIPWESPWRHAASIIRITRAASWKRPTTTYKMSIVAVTMASQERLYTHTSHIHQHSSLFHFECGIFALSFRCLNWSANADKSQKNLSFECNNSLLCTHFFGTSKLITSLTFRICFAQLSPDDNTMITRRPLLVYKLFLPMNTVTYYKLGNRNVSIKILFLFGC